MALSGYGSPSTIGLDAGYGSPSFIALDAGYGSPSMALALIPSVVSETTLPDIGGDIVTLQGTWGAGPYYVRLVDSDGNVYPSVGYCWSGVPGNGPACYPQTNGANLTFVTPAVTPAVFTVRVYLDEPGTSYSDAANQITIVRRVYYGLVYEERRTFPSQWLGPGPRRIRDEHQPPVGP